MNKYGKFLTPAENFDLINYNMMMVDNVRGNGAV